MAPSFTLLNSPIISEVAVVAVERPSVTTRATTGLPAISQFEHGTGSGWTPEGQAKLFERIAAKGLSFVDNEEVLMWTAQMCRLNAPMIFNHEDWGLAGSI